MKQKRCSSLSVFIQGFIMIYLVMSMSGCLAQQKDMEGGASESLISSDTNVNEVENQNKVQTKLEREVSTEESSELLENEENQMVVYFTDCLSNTANQRTVHSAYINKRNNILNQYYIDEEGILWGRGSNAYAQLGIDDPEDVNNMGKEYGEPIFIADKVIHLDISQNGYFIIFITDDHKLYGLGQNTYGVLRQEYVENEENQPWLNLVTSPVLIMENVQFASAGRESITVLTDEGEVYWWGRFQAFTGTEGTGIMESWEPKLMLNNARYVTCSSNSAAAIDQDNNLWLWGCNVWGQCAVEGADYIEEPVKAAEKVEMVWSENFSSRKAVYERDGDPLRADVLMDCYYSYTTIIRKNGGEYYACGIDLGAKEKTAQLHGGLMYPGAGAEFHTHNYSSEFIKIRVEEIEEIGREDNEI